MIKGLTKLPSGLFGVSADAADLGEQALSLKARKASLPFTARRTLFNNTAKSAARAYGNVELPLADVKALAKATGTSVNDVVMTVIDDALHHYLAEHQASTDRPLVAFMPMSLREKSGEGGGNRVSAELVPMGAPKASPVERLKEINAATTRAKDKGRGMQTTSRQAYALLLLGSLTVADALPRRSTEFCGARVKPLGASQYSAPNAIEDRRTRGLHRDSSNYHRSPCSATTKPADVSAAQYSSRTWPAYSPTQQRSPGMTWQIVFVVICVIVAGVAALFWRLPSDDTTRSRAKTVTIAAVAAAAVFFFLGCFTIVGTRQFAIMTTFGRPTGVSLNNGFHGKWPWQMTHPMDGAVQIDKYVKEGNTDQRITVRLGNQSTALADVSIRWQLKQAAAPELFQQYKTFDNVRVNLIERNLSVALNEVFAGFNPLDPRNLDVSPLPSLAKRAADILRQDVGGQVDIFDVNVPTIQYDQSTEDKINQLNQQRAQTSIALEAQRTAEAQAKANEILSRSISDDPNVVVQNCITAAINKGISPLGCWPGSSALPTIAVPGR